MLHRLLATQYRSLARGFAEEGAAVESLACLATAAELHPTDEVSTRKILEELLENGLDSSPRADSECHGRFARRKQKLDELVAKDRKIVGSIPAGDSAPSLGGVQASLPREMAERLVRLEVRLSGIDGERYERAYLQVKAMLQECYPEGPPSLDEVTARGGAETHPFASLVDTLSVEHELHNLANEFYQREQFDQAIHCYDLALDLNQDLLETLFNRALAHTRNKNYDRAESDLTKVIDSDPTLAEAWYTRGLVHEYQREYAEALADYDKALEVDPGYQKAAIQRPVAEKKLQESQSPQRGNSDEEHEGRIRDFSCYLSKPRATLADVGGHRAVKQRLRTIVAYLSGDPALEQWGAELPHGVLLCGRPGIGKTHLARCLAGEAKCPFYAPPTSVFEDMWAGNMQKNLRRLWEQAADHSQAILFLDEFDSLGSRRSGTKAVDAWYNRMVGCLLELMDNLARRSERIVVVAATNRRDNIDPAFLRPGRFSYVIEVDPPSAVELAEIWLIHLDAAADRAKRVDFLAPELSDATFSDRHRWVEKAFTPGAIDRSGIVGLARLAEEKDLVGDDVREVIRRAIDERVMAAVECGLDLGPLAADDLFRHLRDYESQSRCVEDEA